jgi:geranylgeranyl pyrophosphate synthase
MSSITIVVSGTEYETVQMELSSDQVVDLYNLRKTQAVKITELEKKIKDTELSLKYSQEAKTRAEEELQQAHALMSALGIIEKTNEEETYYRKALTLSTRIALYLAK